jgi:aminoglycoside phosphotransferase family enzyme
MSWVFLTERFAYKMKKPVKWDRLDFSTLALRRTQCENEIILNRRLAPAVYLGLVRMTCDEKGRLRLGGQGEAVEWLVRMVRLPTERKLERLVEERRVHDHDLVSAMELLVRFYRAAPPVHMAGPEYRLRLANEIASITAELLSSQVDLPSGLIRDVAASLQTFVQGEAALLEARAGRVIDAHGDLRPQHIYVGSDPAIIDCLEFDRELRLREPLDELSFLRLECDRLGDPRPGDLFIARYREALGDPAPAAVIRFYAAYRAYERARLAVGHLKDPDIVDPAHAGKWRERALTYLRLAEAYAAGSRYPG